MRWQLEREVGLREGPPEHFIMKLFKHREELKDYYNKHPYALHPVNNCQHSPKCAYKKCFKIRKNPEEKKNLMMTRGEVLKRCQWVGEKGCIKWKSLDFILSNKAERLGGNVGRWVPLIFLVKWQADCNWRRGVGGLRDEEVRQYLGEWKSE